jgi:Bacteriodetes cell division protein (FtsL-like)
LDREQQNIISTEQQEATEPRPTKRFRINYLWLVKHLPFILYLSLLALIYIANGYYADKNIRAINKTSNELKELRWQYLNLKSDLMFRSKLSEVAKSVAPMGLEELTSPPQQIVIDTTK